MRLINSSGSVWPGSFLMIPQVASRLPAVSEVFDGHRVPQTSAVGKGIESLRGAIGEFMERRHFYNEVKMGASLKLSDMMEGDALSSFLNALRQTSVKGAPAVEGHSFFTAQAFNLFSYVPTTVPAILISLTDKGAGEDPKFLPFRDTTGCSVHVDFETALNGAIGELIERQCLLRFWMTKQVIKEIEIDTSISDLKPDIAELIARLSSSGLFKIYDITIPGLPGHTIISLFGTDDRERYVQYCAGLSYSFSPISAIEKAVIELWQIFILLHYSIASGYDGNNVEDYYHRHFWFSNNINSYRSMTSEAPLSTILLGDYLCQEPINRNILENYLYNITKNIYFYMAKESIGIQEIWFVRAFSPDLFLHMNCPNALNHDNLISAAFPHVFEDRRNELVLFP